MGLERLCIALSDEWKRTAPSARWLLVVGYALIFLAAFWVTAWISS